MAEAASGSAADRAVLAAVHPTRLCYALGTQAGEETLARLCAAPRLASRLVDGLERRYGALRAAADRVAVLSELHLLVRMAGCRLNAHALRWLVLGPSVRALADEIGEAPVRFALAAPPEPSERESAAPPEPAALSHAIVEDGVAALFAWRDAAIARQGHDAAIARQGPDAAIARQGPDAALGRLATLTLPPGAARQAADGTADRDAAARAFASALEGLQHAA